MNDARRTPRAVLMALAVVGLFALAAWQWNRVRPVDLAAKAVDLHADTGTVLADLLGRHAPKAAKVLLVLPDESGLMDEEKKDWSRREVAAFEKSLARAGGAVHARLTVADVLPRMDDRAAPTRGFTLALCLQALERNPGADAVVSFAGAPFAPPGTKPGELPPMVCFAPGGEHVRQSLHDGLLVAAIVPRRDAVPYREMRGNWFEILYEVVTRDTVDAWSAAVSGAEPAPR